jgi:chromosome segregation ATPase
MKSILAKSPQPKHCQCAACTRPAEVLDVLEALQIDNSRHRNHVALLLAEVERHKTEELRLARQLDHAHDEQLRIARERESYRAAAEAISSPADEKSSIVGVIVCVLCIAAGAVWSKWMGGR